MVIVIQFSIIFWLQVAPQKPVVLMSWKGTDPSLPSVLLNSHTDVVPVFRVSSCILMTSIIMMNGECLLNCWCRFAISLASYLSQTTTCSMCDVYLPGLTNHHLSNVDVSLVGILQTTICPIFDVVNLPGICQLSVCSMYDAVNPSIFPYFSS